MIQKWKTILTNWINCYSSETEKRQQNITPENLLNIFTHIQENLKQDDSMCSKLEAQTVQDFIVEKYPEFKFENGTLEASTEEDVYIVASLLLFFVCVNSKNEDIKRVMCSKLNGIDQETILKFSKCLMDCSPVLYADVEAAITEACRDVSTNVAETPPALRSLHGEVRRLQAALDAERFDRNYLQDELARTSLKLDKLKKDKEQYKLDIVNLKAKISLCCGEQREARSEARADDSRLQRQLQELEERLVDTHDRLDEMQHERDTYKKKVDDLKQERDKWLALCQQEADKAGQLTDQLDTERRTVQSLKDLVSELRQHNRNNRLDTSMLECDDPDTSIHSLNNLSVCSEACANVVEVQLGEERAKIEVLNQQIQGLKDQLSEASQKYESAKLSLEAIISEKDNDLLNLKHRINEEIEEKNNLNTRFTQEVSQLSTKIVELTQQINDNEVRAKLALDEKIHELQSLQQQMAEETKKFGNMIKNLQIELEAEKYAQLKLKDDCDSRIMKLNEKVLNRNNELVELQNNIIMKSEMIELIQSDLRKEKELRDELSNSCNNQLLKLNEQRIAIENDIQQKAHEIAESQKQLYEKELCIDRLSKEVEKFRITVSSLEEKCQQRECKIIDKQKEIEFLNDVFQKEQEKLVHKVDERNATIKSLQMQLQNEIEYKVELQKDLTELQTSNTTLVEEVSTVKSSLLEKERMLDAMETYLKEEKKSNEDLKLECAKKNEDLQKHADEISNMNSEIKLLQDQLETEKKILEAEIKSKDEIIESTKIKLSMSDKEIADLQESVNTLTDEKSKLVAAANEKQHEHLKLKAAYEKLCRDHHENKQNFKSLEAKLNDEVKKNEQLQDSSEKNTSKLLLKLEKTEKSIKKIHAQSKSILDSKDLQIQKLTMEITSLQQTIESEREMLTIAQKEKDVLEKNLSEEVYFRNRLEEEYQKKCKILEDVTSKLNDEIFLKNKEIENLSQAILKFENVIIGLKTEVDSEKITKLKIKEEYEKHVHEISEKELKNNKELADKNAKIERMLSDLKQEKELKDQFSNMYQNDLTKVREEKSKIESDYQQQVNENEALQKEMKVNVVLVEELKNEVAEMKSFAANLEQECCNLKETNDNLLKEVETRGNRIEENQALLEETITKVSNEKEILIKALDENINKLESLETQMQLEMKLKTQFEEKNTELEATNNKFKETISNLSLKIHELQIELKQKNAAIENIQERLEEKIIILSSLDSEVEQMKNSMSVLTEKLKEAEQNKEQLIKENISLCGSIDNLQKCILNREKELNIERETLNIKSTETSAINTKLIHEMEQNNKLQNVIAKIETENTVLKEINDKLLQEVSETQCLLQEKDKLIQAVDLQLKEEKMKTKNIIHDSDIRDTKLNKITEQVVLKDNELKVLNEQLQQAMNSNEKQLLEKDRIIEDIKKKLEFELSEKDTLQKTIQSIKVENAKLMHEVKEKCEELLKLKINYDELCQNTQENAIDFESEKQSFYTTLSAKEDELLILNNKLVDEMEQKTQLKANYDEQIETLKQTVKKLENYLNENEMNSKLSIDKKMQDMQCLEKLLTGERAMHEKAINSLKIEFEAEKISKLKLKEENESHVVKLNKKIINMNNELLQLQNSVIENKEKAEVLLSEFNKEKESKEELSKKCDIEISKLYDVKNTLENELLQKLQDSKELQGRLDEKMISIEQLNKEIDDLRSYCTDLQKDNKNLEESKAILLTVVEERDKEIAEYVKGESILATLVNNLEFQLKTVTEQLQKQNDLTETRQTKLLTEVSENNILKNNLGSLNEEHLKLTSDLSEKVMEVTQLKVENQQLLRMTQETEAIIRGLESKFLEDSMKITHLKNSTDTEISRLINEINEMEKVIKNKDLEIHNIDSARQKLQQDLTRQKDYLLSVQKENEDLEDRIKEQVSLKNKFEKECENQRVMLKGITEKLNENVVIQNNEAIEMTKEIQSLRKAVEQKCEELKIAEDSVSKQTQAFAELNNSKHTEISHLLKKVESLQSFNDELEQELKNETDKKMQIIEALQKDNEQLQYIIEEDNSNHEILLKEKDNYIEVLDEKLKYVTNQLESIKKDYEDKTLMWEKLKLDADEKVQVSLLKIAKLEEEKAILMKEIEALKERRKELLAVATQENTVCSKNSSWEKDTQGLQNQVDTTTSDLTHSSMDSLKTISDLEKIVQDKNRKITTMHTEITHIKSVVAESGLKLIDVTKELEVSKDTCEELSTQLKKIVQQKNEEIAELKRQVVKMSATENRASQIIKVSAKYQAMILKRIAEIKSTAVLKELTNFGNSNSNGDNELRRSLTAGSVTMEDLENFLETTDRHLKRCSEKQMALQKERDRLSEVNRINESEVINMKKFLTEMSVSFRTFTTVKDVYSQKLSKIVSLQRAVRRDVLSLDGHITEATMYKLERGYAAVMQDLAECAMNIERWVDRSVSRMLSPEKIRQAFTSDLEQTSLCTANYQNAAVEVQLSELEHSFQKLLGEVGRAQQGDGARSAQELSVMEVRAEYEDKLNRMKAKMKELFHEEMGRLKQKQCEEIAVLERELIKSREKLAESSRAYEDHIRALTTELWSVGEKFLVKQEEADWLRKKQSGSLMSLQHVHSAGLHPPQEVMGRPSDTLSLRSLPMHNKKTESRGLHMSDEEGEVFDNRFLKELSRTPRSSLAPGQRISELKRRNSLVPPHLKSSYPAETQFAPIVDEEDIKCVNTTSFSIGRQQRKEVGITAYKKPGPPTPSKQAGRLSATDSELRESLRVEADPHTGRKTSTPSRIRSLFRSHRTDADEGTPRSRRFSNIFRKKY